MGLIASLRFAAVSAAQNLWRNLAISLASVVVIFLILVMVGGTFVVTHMGDQVLSAEQQRASSIKVFIHDGVSQASIARFAGTLAKDQRVQSVQFENRDAAAAEAESRGLPGADKLQELQLGRVYPASVNLQLKNLDDESAIDTMVKRDGIVLINSGGLGSASSATNYDPAVIGKLQKLIHWLQAAGVIVALVLGAISLVIIMVTIRTAVAVRSREIEIMKLVGATNWFVRLPFILEGVICGVLAAIGAAAIIALGYHPIVDGSRSAVGFFPFVYDPSYLLQLSILLILVGGVLGAIGSFLGVWRFLLI